MVIRETLNISTCFGLVVLHSVCCKHYAKKGNNCISPEC